MKNREEADSEDWTPVLGLPASACEFCVGVIDPQGSFSI